MQDISFGKQVHRWDIFEATVQGPTGGNPFVDESIEATFQAANGSTTVSGFYDGDGVYKVRFMPTVVGEHSFTIKGSFFCQQQGSFSVLPARSNNHGPVRVAATHHFAYEDGTPYFSVGTTCYVWELQTDEEIQKTLDLLKKSRFNKIRFCVFPKHYEYNLGEPRSYPYVGTPMESSVLTVENFNDYTGKTNGNNWDFTRFNPQHFRHIETCITQLAVLGIQADIIVMHPYDRWGFSSMTSEQDDLYWKYIVARFSAHHNVWWSLANEYDLMPQKTIADWERYAQILCDKDPYRHLRSIHNCAGFYDYSRPWITHCSIQRQECYMSAEYVDKWRETYKKPIVMDEMSYEGNVQFGWGNISGEEMLRRFWETACRGGYPGHGETFHSENGPVWWSHGGELHGESWKRVGFLYDILSVVPGGQIAPLRQRWDAVTAVPEQERTKAVKSWYLIYYSFMQPYKREFYFDDTTSFKVEVIDTWNMTIEEQGVFNGEFRVNLPSRPYMAVRLSATKNSGG